MTKWYRKAMELRRLRYFLRVAAEGSLGSASRALGIAQPALSRQMQLLETELGVQLFVRISKGMRLTEEGEYLRDALSHPMQQLDVAFRNVRSFTKRVEATCVMGLPPLIAETMGPRIVRRLERDLPNFKLRLQVEDSARLNSGLLRGTVDVAILVGLAPDGRLHHGEMLREDLFLVGAPDSGLAGRDTVAFRELENYSLILPAPPASVPVTLEKVAARFGTRLHVAFEIDSLSVRKDLLRDGKHFSVMPMLAVKDEIASGTLAAARITEPDMPQTIYYSTQTHWRVPRSIYNQFYLLFYDELAMITQSGEWPATLLWDREATQQHLAETPAR